MNKKRGILRISLVLLLFIVALGLIVYPYAANWVFENRTDSIVNQVEEEVEQVDDSEKNQMLADAENYNEVIASGKIQLKDPFADEVVQAEAGDYNSLLCTTTDGVMGFVEIPSIDVRLPIYHGTASATLEKGVGHLEGTSLPIGGKGTHTVLTGHTGLSNAKLFTDLILLDEGDIFFLKVLGDTLAYRVDQIKVVLPTELSDLYVTPGQDYCTLVTCTPYGVNTHRLLVRGTRVDYEEAVENPVFLEQKEEKSQWMAEYQQALMISFGCFAGCLLLLFFIRSARKKQNFIDDFL